MNFGGFIILGLHLHRAVRLKEWRWCGILLVVLTGGVSARCEALDSGFGDFTASVVLTVMRE